MLTAVFQVFATDNMAALGDKKPRHDAILWIDTVGDALDCVVLAGVDFRKGS